MNVIVLGGCGIMGGSVVRDLIKNEDIRQVVVADKTIDLSGVHESIQNCDRVVFREIDVSDREKLTAAIRGNDVVVNCVGPYYKYGMQTIKAAIEAGVNYLDIMDDYDTTEEAFALDEAAREAGVTVCIGFGSSPGFANIIARYAADKMDEVDEIRMLWGYALNDPAGPGVTAHMLHAFEGDVPQFIDGRLVNVEAGSGGEEIVYFPGYGNYPVFYLGHPEPLTIPRYIKGVKTVVNKGFILPLWANQLFLDLVRYGLAGSQALPLENGTVSPRNMIAQLMHKSPSFKESVKEYTTAPLTVVVKGREGGCAVAYTYHSAGRMAPGTGIPASICAQMLSNGEITAKGVVPPEACVEPQVFFKHFARRGFTLAETREITREIQF